MITISIPQIERARAAARTDDERRAIEAAFKSVNDELRFLRFDAGIALEHQIYETDLRGAILRYIVAHAAIYERTSAEQIAQFLRDQDPHFAALAIAAWGVAL